MLSLEESALGDVCRDTVPARDFDGRSPDSSDDSNSALLAALLFALAFAAARMTPRVALDGVRGRAGGGGTRGDATPLPRARVVDQRR